MSVIPWPNRLRTGFTSLLDAVLPPRCPATGALVGVQGTLSPDYWAQLHFLHKPFCACCGNPFPVAADDGMLCGRCMTDRPPYRTARAALAYDDASSALLLKFKYADKTLLAKSFAAWMATADEDALRDADLLIPVPLHRWRLLKRRYNQAALLCDALSARLNIRTSPLLLRRIRRTESQGRKSKAERLDNLRGAFAVSDKHKTELGGKNVVLVDDVLTSGATVGECAKTLLAAGANRVDVLTLARVVQSN